MMSRPRGVRTVALMPAVKMMSETARMRSGWRLLTIRKRGLCESLTYPTSRGRLHD
jgi:hypothetical protein